MLLLPAIDSGPSHGYAIAETLRQRSNGAFELPDGTIYAGGLDVNAAERTTVDQFGSRATLAARFAISRYAPAAAV